MKRLLSCLVFLLLVTRAAAGWYDLKPGMDQNAAVQCVGQPILKTKGRAGAEVWTYDHAGYILFNQGRVTYWEVPIPKRVAGEAPQKTEERKPEPEKRIEASP